MDATTVAAKPPQQAAHPQGLAAVRHRRHAAGVHRRDGQHHPGERAADHRPRLQRRPQSAVADHVYLLASTAVHAALRQDRRHPRPPPHALHRDRDPHGGFAGLRAGAIDDGADLRPRRCRASAAPASPRSGVVVLGDVAAPKERGKLLRPISPSPTPRRARCGPALGGFLADHCTGRRSSGSTSRSTSPRSSITSTLLRRLPRYERPHRLDLIGAVLIVAASVSFMLGLNLARHALSMDCRRRSLALFGAALVGRRAVRVAAAHRARAADPARDPQRSGRALGDHRQRLRMERRSSGSTSSCRSTCRAWSACRRPTPA